MRPRSRQFLIVLLAAPLHAADTPPPLIAAGATHRDGFSVRLPNGWSIDDARAATSRTRLLARAPDRDTDDTGEYQSVFSITVEDGGSVDGAAQQARLANSFANYQPTEKPVKATIGGVAGVRIGGTFSLGPLKLRSRQYLVTHGDKIYVLTFTSLDSVWGKYLPAIEASVGTFTFAAPTK